MKEQILVGASSDTWYGYIYDWMDRHASDDGDWVTGFLPIIMYKLTGDTTYAEDAYTLLKDQFLDTSEDDWGGDYRRRWPTRISLIYDWTYDYLTSSRRSEIIAKGNDLISYIVSTTDEGTSSLLSTSDTDEVFEW